MATFQFDNNIGDVVCFGFQNDEGTCGGTMRGTIRSIIIGEDNYGYTIETIHGTNYVKSEDVVRSVYSTKSFDVMHPGIEVYYYAKGRSYAPMRCVVEAAYIERGRLYYRLRDSEMDYYVAPEGLVDIVQTNDYNLQYYA